MSIVDEAAAWPDAVTFFAERDLLARRSNLRLDQGALLTKWAFLEPTNLAGVRDVVRNLLSKIRDRSHYRGPVEALTVT